MNHDRVVLIGAVGMSPAVLTETVWALAQENPPIVPDEVVAITTSSGREQIQKELFNSGVWRELQQVLNAPQKLKFGASASIQVIGNGQRDFEDIASMAENEAAADFILRVLRQYSEDPSTRVIASIAGGRKTMSALMLACMSLLGREQDRVCHVLANDDFIRQHPGFYFPGNGTEAVAAGIQLADIPFVRVRKWYLRETFQDRIPSYSQMVALFQSRSEPMPSVVLYDGACCLAVGDLRTVLEERDYACAKAFVKDRLSHPATPKRAAEYLQLVGLSVDDDFRRGLNRARSELKKSGVDPEVVARLLPDIRTKEYTYRDIKFRKGRPRTSE